MTVPRFYFFIEPVLRVLAERNGPMPRREIVKAAIARMDLSESDKAELAGWKGKDRGVTKVKDRAGWAITYANKGDWITSAARGHWAVSDEGRALLAEHPEAIPERVFQELITQIREAQRERRRQRALDDGDAAGVDAEVGDPELSPEEQIKAAYQRLRDDVGAVLLSSLRAAEPAFLEKTVVDLLGAMGYGADDDALEVTGASGDGGIDGVVRLDKLGLEHVYVQAKRHSAENKVQRKDIQAFFGALSYRGASKGVFITTGYFASGALEFADRREGIVLIDGDRLAELMIDHGIGVERRDVFEVVRVDDSFFGDED